ncbi:MAG TPA: hypothetical protein VGH49_10265 [Xanthobacteraceae bacterium]
MRNTRTIIAAVLTVLAAAIGAAQAKDAADTDDFARRLFAAKSIEQKTYACFVRTYDATHLAHHRKQKVSAMKLLIAVDKPPEDAELHYVFRVGIKLRNRKPGYASDGDCGHAEVLAKKDGGIQVSCGGDCGGSGMSIALGPDDKSVTVRLNEIAIWLADNPTDDSAQMELKGGADDRVFRLDRVSNEICAPLAREGENVAASQPD